MPIRDYPFLSLRPNGISRPYLLIKLTNPHTGLTLNTIGQVDTGADVCTFPAAVATLLGHDLSMGQASSSTTANGAATAYAHTTTIEVLSLKNQVLLTIPNIQVHYMENLNTGLIGVNGFLDPYHLHINYPKRVFSIMRP